jgi:hypothetical protein
MVQIHLPMLKCIMHVIFYHCKILGMDVKCFQLQGKPFHMVKNIFIEFTTGPNGHVYLTMYGTFYKCHCEAHGVLAKSILWL